MAFGFKLWDPSGTLRFDSTDVTWNQVDFFQVNANATVTRTYSQISGNSVAVGQIMIDPPLGTRKAVAHDVTVSGTTVTISGGSENVYILVLVKG